MIWSYWKVVFFALSAQQVVVGTSTSSIVDIYGCRYRSICPEPSICVNDLLFGHCGFIEEPRFLFYFDLNYQEGEELLLILAELRKLGQKWTDLSTQLVVNDFLKRLRYFETDEEIKESSKDLGSSEDDYLQQIISDYPEGAYLRDSEIYDEAPTRDEKSEGDAKSTILAADYLNAETEEENRDIADSKEKNDLDGDLGSRGEGAVAEFQYEPEEQVFYYYYYPEYPETMPVDGKDYDYEFDYPEETMQGVLKREAESSNEAANVNSRLDSNHGEKSISELEKEYSEYVDSKYDEKGKGAKDEPTEHYSISKAPTAKKQDERKDKDAAEKREQLTLFNNGEGEILGPMKLDSLTLPAVDPNFCFVQTQKPITYEQGNQLILGIMNVTGLDLESYNYISFGGRKVTFYVEPDPFRNATQVAKLIMKKKDAIEKDLGIKIESTGIGREDNERIMFTSTLAEEKNELALVCVALLGCIVGLLCGVLGIVALKKNKKKKGKAAKLNAALSGEENFTSLDYQELCREHKAVSKKNSSEANKGGTVTQQPGGEEGMGQPLVKTSSKDRGESVSSELSDRASVSSWNEEPCGGNLDITTGHIVLAYMESHLHDKSQLDAEWEALCAYEPEEVSFAKATCMANQDKNRFPTALPFDRNCITLNPNAALAYGDYINASAIRDTHPERAAYILAQAPLENTVADFWQMVWEQRCTVTVLFAGPFHPLSGGGGGAVTSDGLPQFWPAEGNAIYHNFEVHLVSEHVWCEEYLVRSVYLKNRLTSQTRTVTLFHYLAWMPQKCPDTGPRPLLEFRRKVSKAYKGKNSPIIVMCGSGCDQSACYVLIDLVLNKIYRGAKEIDISATLEHLRDQRCGAVANKDQFEFCLSTVAEEVNSILKSIEPNNTSNHNN
ncbi:receptor-type tyrosine-protein phosphatase N2-like [Symsagittifera roscoffensis]|uniref:receptor-type tyrosine-protein phosphatase N2-like n=1 Tax=Symsagittifera roscoffensis TaxID=84072 RepID=UPI00307B6A31